MSEEEIIEKVRKEVEAEVKEYLPETSIGYETEVISIMKERLEKKGITWPKENKGIIYY